MLNNFIYAKQKSLFEQKLNNGGVLDEAIVFIEDTKEIWNHGTYFDGSKVDLSNIEASILNILETKQNTLVSGTNIKTINGESILGEGDINISSGTSDANVAAVDTSDVLDDVETNTYVKYVAQTLTDSQKAQVRTNIGIDLSSYATTSYVNEQVGNINSILESIING